MIPAISSASNTVYTSGYYRHNGGWKVVGMDWNTGQTVHSTVFNDNICGNGIYAQMEFMPDGDLLMNSIRANEGAIARRNRAAVMRTQ